MTTDGWVEAAATDDVLVAELLLRMKHSNPTITHRKPTSSKITSAVAPIRWGHRRSRSKPPTGKYKEQGGSPTTHLSWSGGGGSTSDGLSDLESAHKSFKPNEGASTSSCNKSLERKSFSELQNVENSLLKTKTHINKELMSMRVTMNEEMASSQNLKRVKINLDESSRNRKGKMVVDEQQMELQSLDNKSLQISCRVEAEREGSQRGFLLPDLNMALSEDDLMMMS
uniref:uncharacterized protein LOC122581078 n=1 Tax=Erigeron canadensis TaxID=72917 RepID=UPI001CB9D42B|nr:uncharacterized protein LOC122581078 [Erigeron canadensis]